MSPGRHRGRPSATQAEPSLPGDFRSAREFLAEVHRRLVRAYGLPADSRPSPATEELVRTILSQNTNDTNRDRAFHRLREAFPTWEELAAADTAEVAEAIRPGGLADIKAPRIQRALDCIRRQSGRYDLSFICEMETERALDWLRALPGVGPKTAACVLLFSCRKPVMPVDTHILRVTSRLGLLPQSSSLETAHEVLGSAVPPEAVFPLHINLIRHGRQTCPPRAPLCVDCVPRDVCRCAGSAP